MKKFVLAAVTAAALLIVGVSSASAATPRNCGMIYPTHADAAQVWQAGSSCRTARRVLLYYGDTHRVYPGWRCSSLPVRYYPVVFGCVRGRQTALVVLPYRRGKVQASAANADAKPSRAALRQIRNNGDRKRPGSLAG